MTFLRIIDGQTEKYSIGQLRRDNPQTSFPKDPGDDLLREWGVYPYSERERPWHDPRYQSVVEDGFAQTDDGWRLTWRVEDHPASASDVKDEAMRRILAICPEWKQRNLTAQAAILAEKGRANWTPEETAAWAAGQAIWEAISAVRAASDQIEATDPIPPDYMDDRFWP